MGTIKVGGMEVRLGAPQSYSVRSEIVAAGVDNWRRAYAAALGACWRPVSGGGAKRLRTTYKGAGYNPLVFGAMVADELIEAGATPEEIYTAGGEAYVLLSEGLPDWSAVEEVAGNSEGGASTS